MRRFLSCALFIYRLPPWPVAFLSFSLYRLLYRGAEASAEHGRGELWTSPPSPLALIGWGASTAFLSILAWLVSRWCYLLVFLRLTPKPEGW